MSTIVTRTAGLAAVAALAATLVAAPAAHAEPAGDEPGLAGLGELVDEVMAKQLADGNIPGAAVSIVSGGEVLHSKGYGYADLESETPVDPASTGFYAASTAKLFTAAAVLQLEASGDVDLDADVNEYLDFDIPDTYSGEPVTMEHLLTHTSGFDPDYGMVGKSVADPKRLPSLRDSLIDHLPDRVEPPGTVIAYDNYGLALAGYIVEQVAKTPYEDYIAEHVFAPLDMKGSTAKQPHPDRIADTLATGYRPDGDGQDRTAGNYDPWTPTGPGQVVTPADMAKFMIDQLAADSALGEGIPADLMKQHYTQHKGMPGLGYVYEERPRNGQRVLFKGGDGSGFHNDMVLLPEHGLGVFVIVNGDGGDDLDLGAVADAIIDEYFPAGDPETPEAIDDTDVTEYAGVYQSSRVSHSSILKMRVLTESRVVVTAGADGTLTTTDRTLSTNDEADSQNWVQIEPGRFQETDGPGTIAFADGVLTESRGQNQVYLKQSWYESTTLHQYLLVGALLILAVAVLWLPILALRRRGHSRAAKLARLLAWLTAATAVAATTGLVLLLSNRDAAVEALAMGSPVIYAVMIAASAVVLGALGMAAATVTAWVRGWWRVRGRVSYTALSLAALSFAAFAVTYNLTGPPFD